MCEISLQSCMILTKNFVVVEFSINVMNSGKVMPFSYWIKSFVVALFSVKPMNSVNLMSVKVMHDCILFLSSLYLLWITTALYNKTTAFGSKLYIWTSEHFLLRGGSGLAYVLKGRGSGLCVWKCVHRGGGGHRRPIFCVRTNWMSPYRNHYPSD